MSNPDPGPSGTGVGVGLHRRTGGGGTTKYSGGASANTNANVHAKLRRPLGSNGPKWDVHPNNNTDTAHTAASGVSVSLLKSASLSSSQGLRELLEKVRRRYNRMSCISCAFYWWWTVARAKYLTHLCHQLIRLSLPTPAAQTNHERS